MDTESRRLRLHLCQPGDIRKATNERNGPGFRHLEIVVEVLYLWRCRGNECYQLFSQLTQLSKICHCEILLKGIKLTDCRVLNVVVQSSEIDCNASKIGET